MGSKFRFLGICILFCILAYGITVASVVSRTGYQSGDVSRSVRQFSAGNVGRLGAGK